VKFYYSGIHSRCDARLLEKGSASRIMVPARFAHFVESSTFKEVWLDSDAYWHYKHGGEIDVARYVEQAITSDRLFCRMSAPDVIGDAHATYCNWKRARHYLKQCDRSIELVPVWGWDTPTRYLRHYLKRSPIVGIGGLVPLMRMGKSKVRSEQLQAVQMLKRLKRLCQRYPQRFHIYGCNWTIALNHLHGLAYSADSSIAWDAARYGLVVHYCDRTQQLQRLPARELGLYDRQERCLYAIQALARFSD
jgi:hypothetical protein